MALLLSFTLVDLAGDLTGAPLCATDAGTEGSSAAPAPPLAAGAAGDEGNANPEHIDDCFCCSGCVEISPLFTFEAALWTVRSMSPDKFRSRSLPPAELYRPPRTS